MPLKELKKIAKELKASVEKEIELKVALEEQKKISTELKSRLNAAKEPLQQLLEENDLLVKQGVKSRSKIVATVDEAWDKTALEDSTIQNAVDDYYDINKRKQVEEKYGHIGLWNVSNVSLGFRKLFAGKRKAFDLSGWVFSADADLSGMFMGSDCGHHNMRVDKPLLWNLFYWDTSNVINMSHMFKGVIFHDNIK